MPQRPAGPPAPPSGLRPGGPPAPPPPGGPVGGPSPQPPKSGRRGLVILGAVIAVAIAAGVVFVLASDDDDDPVATGPSVSADSADPTTTAGSEASAAPVVTVPVITIPLPSVGLVPTPATVASGVPLPPGEPPGDLGDDAELDALAVGCFDGDMGQCDTLFLRSDFDSDYHTYGDTCAGRQPATTGRLCADVFAPADSAPTTG